MIPPITRTAQADVLRAALHASDTTWIEVEHGVIHEVNREMTWLHLFVIQNLYRLLDPFVRQHGLGLVFTDGARYRLAGTLDDVQRAYVPDFSYLRTTSIPAGFDWSVDFPGAPDLAVEVASPGQGSTHLMARVARYLEAGSAEVWLIYPGKSVLWRYQREADEPTRYAAGDALTSALFPGFTLSMDTLFTRPTP